MHLQRTHIRLGVDDSTRSTAFYSALLGGPPASRTAEVIVFEFDEPDLLLVLETRLAVRHPRGRTKSLARRPVPRHPATTAQARYALVVPNPELVGRAAVALWRVGAPLRLQDQGIETFDPDGNTWKIRYVPFAGKPAVVAVSQEGLHARN